LNWAEYDAGLRQREVSPFGSPKRRLPLAGRASHASGRSVLLFGPGD
jgi:hypothetical protein